MIGSYNRIGALLLIMALMIVSISRYVLARPPDGGSARYSQVLSIDNDTYIDANRILMFVTNHGNFGRDLGGVFGNDYGTYFPYTGIHNIESGANISSVLYAGGLWLGGVDSATGVTLVTVSEYSSEYVPGPMASGTYQPDRAEFRVYKLYRDSLGDNPNQDFLDWPVNQGAPVGALGHPTVTGEQSLWSVFNDADPEQHDNNNGATPPMGVEVQQSVWAADRNDGIYIPLGHMYQVSGPTATTVTVTATVVNPQVLTNHDYSVVTAQTTDSQPVWHLLDETDGDTVLSYQTDFSGTNSTATDGFLVQVVSSPTLVSFEVVANGAGPLIPPVAGALASQGFPTPGSTDPGIGQQVGGSRWAIHTGDNGGTSGGGTRASYGAFIPRVFREDPMRLERLGNYDWEMRFTGSNDNPGDEGSWAWDPFNTNQAYWTPFELWRTGIDTPDDPSDDLRLIPWIMGDVTWNGFGDNQEFDLSQYGSLSEGSCHDGCEHSCSDGDDDPYTDWFYWRLPSDTTPGETGYLDFESAMKNDPRNWPGNELPVMDRIVLVNLDAGVTPPFSQGLPEQGTVFRLRAGKAAPPGLEFTFHAQAPTGGVPDTEAQALYLKYKIINKGTETLRDFMIGLWLDPDLGSSGDDLIGCDSLTNTIFCYNATNQDQVFIHAIPPVVPAVGFRLLEGPIVPSPSDTATVDSRPVPGYRNLDLYSVTVYINGTDPDNYLESYQYMHGLQAKLGGIPYTYDGQETRFWFSGDPVTGTGDLDSYPDDKRMMATMGPIIFRPGDTQQVVFKMGVGQDTDRLSSLVEMHEVLGDVWLPTDVEEDPGTPLPSGFAVYQNYPNPFNPVTVIKYSLPERAEVEVTVFNVLGQKVTTLVRDIQAPGEHTVVWNGTDATGRAVASGVYFYRVHAGEEVQTRKMMLLK